MDARVPALRGGMKNAAARPGHEALQLPQQRLAAGNLDLAGRRLDVELLDHAFVGSRRKMAALREKLIGEGIDAATLDRIKAPAGLDLGAITPEEIAMSILAEITLERRRGQRG